MNYDFESTLGRLKEGLSGRVSAMEGTVTGDILQAVAAELARIWSQEVDSVTQRGFVSTAQGTWLDAACGDYGITRKEGESDESLRQRTLAHIRRQGAGGTAADYVAWAEALEGETTLTEQFAQYRVELSTQVERFLVASLRQVEGVLRQATPAHLEVHLSAAASRITEGVSRRGMTAGMKLEITTEEEIT